MQERTEPTSVEPLSGLTLLGKLLALNEKIRLGWKILTRTLQLNNNVKSFIRMVPGVNIIKLFTAVIY